MPGCSEHSSTLSEVVPSQPAFGKPKVVALETPTAGGNVVAWEDENICRDDDLSRRRQSGRSSSGKSQSGTTFAPKSRRSIFANLRQNLSHSPWYHSEAAARIRLVAKSKFFGIVMMVALLVALFMPDIWVLSGRNTNTEINLVLLAVMLMFALELAMLSIVDARYLFSFFFFMDIVGTVSMLFDVSWTFSDADHTVPTYLKEGGAAQENLMLLRAARAAKIGARAGRLSRVVRFLRYLPFLTGNHTKDLSEDKGIASVISVQLANSLATRVACLTIVLVMVIPLFDLWTFPESDHSLLTWGQRLDTDYQEGLTAELVAELQVMADFYSQKAYGPYHACIGTGSGDDFQCSSSGVLTGWRPFIGAPNRMASTTRVIAGSVQIDFNMFQPDQVKAGMSMATVVFIIFMMVFSGLTLSNVVTELAVRPLERMLSMVKQIAATVFKISSEVAEDQAEEADIDNSGEMKLLEKVVQKLAVIAQLQTKDEIQKTEDLNDEDVGMLSMLQGKNIVDEKNRPARSSKAKIVGMRKRTFEPVLRLEDVGMSQETYASFSFNPLPLLKNQKCQLAIFTITRFFEQGEGFIRSMEDEATLQRFIAQTEKDYQPNPFHNFSHAVDVCHSTSRILRSINSDAFLTELEQYSLLISSIAHDLGHPGVNNGFLSEVGHELALQYNDRSPLENMHCAKLYTIVANTETNVFASMTRQQYKDARKCCIEVILHTDMVSHGQMVKDLQMMYQMNSEVFHGKKGVERSDEEKRAVECEVFGDPDNKSLVMDMILHSADVSNPCRAWEVTHAWALVCLEEFFAQGDREKELGVPVQFLNDREKLNRPNSQIGFIEFMIAPFFAAQIRLFPDLHLFGENLANNIEAWEDMWVTETNPSEEERQKVRGRVERVRISIENAKSRIE